MTGVQTCALPISRDELIVVEGGLRIDEFSGGGFQLRARNAMSMADACRRYARLLRVKVNGIGPDFISQFRQALAGHRGGNASVLLSGYHNAVAQADFELGQEWKVHAIPELLRTVRGMPGVLGAGVRIVKSDP